MRARWWVFFAAVIICAATLVWAAISGPDPFPTHWGPDGAPDSWSSRGTAIAILAGAAFGTAALLGFFSTAVSKMPNSLINTPQAEYWLSPKQRSVLDSLIQRLLLTVAVGVLLLVSLSVAVSIVAPEGSPILGWTVGIFVALLALSAGSVVWRLIREPRTRS